MCDKNCAQHRKWASQLGRKIKNPTSYKCHLIIIIIIIIEFYLCCFFSAFGVSESWISRLKAMFSSIRISIILNGSPWAIFNVPEAFLKVIFIFFALSYRGRLFKPLFFLYGGGWSFYSDVFYASVLG